MLAVNALHKRGNMAHKDIKADNVAFALPNDKGALLALFDFAYCKPLGEVTDDKRGTPFYAPPEALDE